MYETKLMATEEQACLTHRMEWSQGCACDRKGIGSVFE